jgi:hypothetical protein
MDFSDIGINFGEIQWGALERDRAENSGPGGYPTYEQILIRQFSKKNVKMSAL